MFSMKLLTLASLLIPTALTTPISHPSDNSVTTTTTTHPAARVPLYPYPPGYLAPRAALPPATATTTPISTNALAQLTTHHLPDCLASDPGVPYTLAVGPCYALPISFLSYTAGMAGPLPLAGDGAMEVCKVHVYSAGDCSGYESASVALGEGVGKCTGTQLKVAYPGLAGLGAVGARVVCA